MVTAQIYENVGGNKDRGTYEFVRLFMRCSDYAAREYGWIQKKMDSVKVVYKKRKLVDPNSLEAILSTDMRDMGGCSQDSH